jgi:hypothetical protein
MEMRMRMRMRRRRTNPLNRTERRIKRLTSKEVNFPKQSRDSSS